MEFDIPLKSLWMRRVTNFDRSRNAMRKPKKSHIKSVIYVAHSRDYKKLLGSFGLFRDEKPLTSG